MVGSGGVRERRYQQCRITKLVLNPPLAFRDIDDAFWPVGRTVALPPRSREARSVLFRSIHTLHAISNRLWID